MDDARDSVTRGRNRVAVTTALHRLKMHRDLDPVRNPLLIQEMPEEDQNLANEIWAAVDELLAKLNPPANAVLPKIQ